MKEIINTNTKTKNNITLTQEQYEKLTQSAILQNIVDDLKIDTQLNGIEYENEVKIFLAQCSRNDSKHTVLQYKNGLSKLDDYIANTNINILKLTALEADNFCISLKQLDISNATIRTTISSCSAFFSFLERRHQAIKNPFRGTKTRPPARAKKDVIIPSEAELDFIISNIKNKTIQTAIIFIKHTGVRVGSFDTIRIKNNKYYAYSKGKDITGPVSDDLLNIISMAGLELPTPFKAHSSEVIRNTLYNICKRLFNHGKIEACYSVHDIRHYFAISFYKNTKDLYALKSLLNHSSIAITEIYLKSLELE